MNKNEISYHSGFRIAALLAAGMLLAAIYPGGASAQPDGASAAGSKGLNLNKIGNKLMWGGYYEFEYEDVERIDGSDGEADFDQHRAVLFFGAQPHERIKLFSELEFEHGGEAADMKFEQAWLEFVMTDNLNIRGGIDLIPVGRLNLNHDGNMRDFVLRPVVDERLIPTTWYEAGVSVNGSITDNVDYTVGVSQGLRDATSGVGGFSEIRNMRRTTELSENDNNNSKAVSGRLSVSPWLGTQFGLSVYHARYSPTSGSTNSNVDSNITFAAFDWFIPWGAFEFKGEYVWIDKDQQAGANALTGASGGYGELAYHFFPEFLRDSIIARGFDNPTFTVMGRIEHLDFDTSGGNDDLLDRNVYSIGFNYRPIENMAIKIAYDFEDRAEAGAQNQNRFSAGVALGF